MKPHLLLITSLLTAGPLIAVEPKDDPVISSLENLKKPGFLNALDPAIASIEEKTKKLSAKNKLRVYTDFIDRIMAIYDPQFDTNPPQLFLNLMPGPGPIPGPGYNSGMDPKDIPDKKVRDDYERAIAQNSKNIQSARIQKTLREALGELGKSYLETLKSPEISEAERSCAIEKIRKIPLPSVLKSKFIPEQEAAKPQSPTDSSSK